MADEIVNPAGVVTVTPEPEPNQAPPAEIEPQECPCCYRGVSPAAMIVVANNGQQLFRLCQDCLSRAVVWASKSSVGFILQPVREPKDSEDEKLPPEGPPVTDA